MTAPLKASVNKGQTATDSHQANDELNDSGKSIAPHEVVDQCGSSETEGTASNGNIVFQAPDETSKCVPEPLKGSVSLPSFSQGYKMTKLHISLFKTLRRRTAAPAFHLVSVLRISSVQKAQT